MPPSSSVGPIAASETHAADASLHSLCSPPPQAALHHYQRSRLQILSPSPAASSPHGSPRSLTVRSNLYLLAAVVILCCFPRRNSRIRQQYPRCHLLRRLQPHTDHFGFQRVCRPLPRLVLDFRVNTTSVCTTSSATCLPW